jgi:hypothetical protein
MRVRTNDLLRRVVLKWAAQTVIEFGLLCETLCLVVDGVLLDPFHQLSVPQ